MHYDFALHPENLFEKRCAKSQGHFMEQNHEDRRAKRSEIVLGGTMSDVLDVLTGILPVKCVLLGLPTGTGGVSEQGRRYRALCGERATRPEGLPAGMCCAGGV